MVTVLLLGLTMGGRGKTMSDEEVRERARELGMVESTVLSQMQNQQKQENPEDGDGPGPEAGDGSEADGEFGSGSGLEAGDGESEADGGPGSGDEAAGGSGPENGAQEETVLFTITRGESSIDICRALAEAGLIEDAWAYDRYLCENGYATRIVAETYRIPIGATEEEITRMITKN